LSWLGITEEQSESSDNEDVVESEPKQPTKNATGESSTVSAGNNDATSSSHSAGEKLYPDLREYITSMKSTTDEEGFVKHGKV
jgi:hypothetical protein